MLEGEAGFQKWCEQRKLPFAKTTEEYIQTRKKYDHYLNEDGLIDGMDKLRNTKGYDAIYLDQLFYLDFYAIERFGKTRLGTLLHYAKQGQNRMLKKKWWVRSSRRWTNSFVRKSLMPLPLYLLRSRGKFN
jgi:hypothetical protein